MIEKAKRASSNLLRFMEKKTDQSSKQEAKKALKRAESWKAISDTDFAKHFIEVCDEIKESAYITLSQLTLRNLDEIDGNNLKSIIRAMQQRVIIVDKLLDTFVPQQEQINVIKEQVEEEE